MAAGAVAARQPVCGLEITHDVARDPGKPVFLNTGVHHAREWPTAEFVTEFAWEALEPDGVDPRITSLLEPGKMIVVPVVNPDGYDISRRQVHEQKRKSCRVVPGAVPTQAECERPAPPTPAWTSTATTARSGVAPGRARTSPRRTTAAWRRGRSPRSATCARSRPGIR